MALSTAQLTVDRLGWVYNNANWKRIFTGQYSLINAKTIEIDSHKLRVECLAKDYRINIDRLANLFLKNDC